MKDAEKQRDIHSDKKAEGEVGLKDRQTARHTDRQRNNEPGNRNTDR